MIYWSAGIGDLIAFNTVMGLCRSSASSSATVVG
jgi:hypothetical protein